MLKNISEWIIEKTGHWLTKQHPPHHAYLCDFKKICENLKPADVLLIEGRSRAGRIIKQVTQSPWSHAVLYIGTLDDINDVAVRDKIQKKFNCDVNAQLLVESEIGLGTIISLIEKYKDDHIRIVRAESLTDEDVKKVVNFAIGGLGKKYNIRHLLDLMRFLFPWGLYPRRWRSSLFQHNALKPTEDICSSMIASAFQSVRYPILPLVVEGDKDTLELVRRNPRLFSPSDFDYSPYFSVIKFPILPLDQKGAYANLPWRNHTISDDEGEKVTWLKASNLMEKPQEIKQFFTSQAYAVVGASSHSKKYGNKVLRCYLQNRLKVYPVNPSEEKIIGLDCFKNVLELPNTVKSISIVTPPNVTELIVDAAIAKGIKNIWMQLGAENDSVIKKCQDNGINVIAKGPCILVELGFKE